MRQSPYARLKPFDAESEDLVVVVETPRGCRNKYNFDSALGVFKLGGVLPAGASFPFDFGFVPGTKAADGDPVDVLLLMDEPAFAGCVVTARLIGVIEAEQTERDGKKTRNDRLIAVASKARTHGDLKTLKDVSKKLLEEIEYFFVSYNEARGKKFKVVGRGGPGRARGVVEGAVVTGRKKKKR